MYMLELDNILNRDNKIWFDDNGDAWYGKDINNLVSAERIELSSGYKVPARLYVSDLKNAFLLGKKIGAEKENQAFLGDFEEGDF